MTPRLKALEQLRGVRAVLAAVVEADGPRAPEARLLEGIVGAVLACLVPDEKPSGLNLGRWELDVLKVLLRHGEMDIADLLEKTHPLPLMKRDDVFLILQALQALQEHGFVEYDASPVPSGGVWKRWRAR